MVAGWREGEERGGIGNGGEEPIIDITFQTFVMSLKTSLHHICSFFSSVNKCGMTTCTFSYICIYITVHLYIFPKNKYWSRSPIFHIHLYTVLCNKDSSSVVP